MYSCVYCDKEFKYESEKKRHELSHIPQFECIECLKKFSFMSALRRHQKQHQRTGNVECPQCGRSFRDKTLLERHTQYAHKDIHVCTKCNAKFNSQQALLSHSKTHKPKLERRYKCGHKGCEKTFNFTHHLKHHELTHTDDKQYYCKACGKGFIQLNHYKTHIKCHQPGFLECSDCNKRFSNKYALKRHQKIHKKKILRAPSLDSNIDVFQGICSDNQIKLENTILDASTDENKIGILAEYTVIPDEKHDPNSPEYVSINDNNNGSTGVDKVPAESPKDNQCQSCKCKSKKTVQNNMPQLVYKDDGTIKIKELFDVDIDINVEIRVRKERKQKVSEAVTNSFPLNSCRDVLGKCIVSGSGTINEECLCAKMALDDDQMISQEVDEITPCPTITIL